MMSTFSMQLKLLLATDKVNLLAIAGETGWTALHAAVHQEDPVAIRILLRYPVETLEATTTTTVEAETAEDQRCEERLLRARELLWCHCDNPIGATALHMAVRRNNLECVRVLLEDANWLHSRLAEYRPSEYGVSELEGSCEICCIQDRSGDTALHWAVSNGSHEIAWLLCSYGAQIHKPTNHKGHEPLTICKDVLRDHEMTAILTPFKSSDPPPNAELIFKNHRPSPVLADSASNTSVRLNASSRLRRTAVLPDPMKLPTEGGAQTIAGGPSDQVSQRRPPEQPAMFAEFCRTRPYLDRSTKDNKQVAEFRRQATALNAVRAQKPQQLAGLPALSVEKHQGMAPRLSGLSAINLERKRPSVCLSVPGMTCPAPLLVADQVPLQPPPPKPITLRARRRASLMDPNEYYPMASPRRGICLIMNSMTYWHPKFQDRGGCDKDEIRIEKVFRDLGFLVKLLRNLSSGEMKAQLKHLGTATDHSTYDCFVTIIMAHGGMGEIYGVDGSPFPLHEITSYFTADKCSTLAGKPKLFFIQACRGEEYQLGYAPPSRNSMVGCLQPVPGLLRRAPPQSPSLTVSNPFEARSSFVEAAPVPSPSVSAQTVTANPDAETVSREEEPAVLAANLPRRQRLVPTYADFLISCATKAGFKAQRDPKEGSIYVQSLCRHLEQYGRLRSLLDIITGVHREIGHGNDDDDGDEDDDDNDDDGDDEDAEDDDDSGWKGHRSDLTNLEPLNSLAKALPDASDESLWGILV
ncbi:unnamed protein product [Schistocephalus solidus]|uniref:ANK_REP_REGION domain-containing protein n=1 Tax=Schistocephalus solidus TaxID=70667 RepID=A0A183T319_SCHSO|nr:unnamed protein product [Schistocephalus solidus]